MNWGETTGLQSPQNATKLIGLSVSPQTVDILSRESVYYDVKILLYVLKWLKAF